MAVETGAQRTSRQSRLRWVLLPALAVLAVAFFYGGWKLWEHRRYRRAMAEIRQEIRAGRHSRAVRKLVMLSAWKPDSDEAAYLLGVCEKARGEAPAAFRAWERVSPDSPFGARALGGRMQLLLEQGRLADAEKLIIQTMSDPRLGGSDLPPFLGLVYSQQGRFEEQLRVIEACWDRLNQAGQGASENAIFLVRLHIQLRREVPPVAAARAFLDSAARSAAEDDRVWLGKAKLAIRTGSYDEAARWLLACSLRRPDDIPVWRARLDLALAKNRVADVRQALEHLRVEHTAPAEVERLTAWLAAERGDLGAERRALERLLALDPADFATLDRLVAIAQQEGKVDRAGELRQRKSAVEQLEARYEKLYKRNQTMRDAREMANLAEQLGQRFEAKVFLTIASATDGEDRQLRDQLARLRGGVAASHAQGGTLADLLAKELDAADRARSR